MVTAKTSPTKMDSGAPSPYSPRWVVPARIASGVPSGVNGEAETTISAARRRMAIHDLRGIFPGLARVGGGGAAVGRIIEGGYGADSLDAL